ncbi:MAG: iron-sulfur cluster repair protein YtfE [Rhodoferax sp.]
MNARLESTMPDKLAPAGIDVEQAIGQIAVQLPGATAVFRRLKLDFCCGGNISLRQATVDKKLDLDGVVAELSALHREDTLPIVAEPSVLIDHILTRYHAVHREQLPELIRMARRVEAVHRENPNVPTGLAELLEEMESELLSHMQKEEQILFPIMKAGGNPFVAQPIAMMRHEHIDHGNMLDRVLALTHDATPPPGACNTWRALYAGIAQLNDDLINHIHLENNILFPQFEPVAATAPAATQGCGSGSCGCS